MPLWNLLKPLGSRRRDTVPESNKSSNAPHHRGNTEPGGGWIPLALETPILFGFMALSLLLFATIETLAQRSQAQNGLALSPSYDDIPQYAMIIYLYGPNIVGVLYSLIWNWIDLDIKRMQPWFELSKPSGAAAEDSILLDYPSDFIAAAPIRAAKRKHWAVFLSGTALVLIFWVLTPLQTALLGTAVAKISQSAPVVTRSQFMPTSGQTLNMDKFNQAYGIDWLNQSYPPFTTPNYALLPFYVNDAGVLPGADTNWTAETTKVWAEFTCSPTEYNMTNSSWSTTGILTSEYTFYGKENCTATRSYGGNGPKYTPLPGFGGAEDDLYIEYVPCPNNTNMSYSALVIWAKDFKSKPDLSDKEWKMNITAVDCELSYHKQRVLATITSQNQQPIPESIEPLDEPQNLTLQEFDFNKLTSIIPTEWMFELDNTNHTLDWVDTHIPSIDFKFNNWNMTLPLAQMVPYTFILGDDGATRDTYSNPSALGEVFERFHQQLFSLSVKDLILNETASANDTATITSHMTGIVVSRLLSAISEAILLLIAVIIASILYFVRCSPSALLRNPSSIGRLLDIGHTSPDVVKLFRDLDIANEAHIMRNLDGIKFKLSVNNLSKENELVISQDERSPSEPSQKTAPGYYFPLTPWVLKKRAGAGFVAVLIASIIVLSIFKAKEMKLNGLVRPSENFEVLQILENYIPTIFATLVEPIWIYLTRTLSIFQPFQDLWVGRSLAATSIEATYTSLPPQLVLFRAMKSRHAMLALLCSISLLANVLAVGLGALFNEKPVAATYQQEFQPLTQDQFNYSAVTGYGSYWFRVAWNQYPDFHNYILLANMSSESPLPPWVSDDWYFLPHSIPNLNGNTPGVEYSLTTRGYGMSSNCSSTPACTLTLTNVTMDKNNVTTINYTSTDEVTGKHSLAFRFDGGKTKFTDNSACSSNRDTIGTNIQDWLSEPIEKPAQRGRTDSTPVTYWLRRSPEPSLNNTVQSSFTKCDLHFETAMFSVTIQPDGHVIKYSRISDIESTVDGKYDAKNLTDQLSYGLWSSLWAKGESGWSYTNRTTDWMSHFVYLETGSRNSSDPSLPPPDARKFLPILPKIYRKLFSALLSSNSQFFLPLDENTPLVIGTRTVNETRIFMDKPAFIISVSILFINLGVIMAFYVRPVRYILPRMPTTIGSVLAYLAPSRAIKYGTPSSGWGDQTFSFGRYIGYDGLSHIGIETDPHVLQKDLSLGLHKTLFGRKKNVAGNEL